jgi:hypothetical protein
VDWKKLALVLAAALAAVCWVWRPGGDGGGNLALAAAAPGVRVLGSGLVAVTTGGPGGNGNRLVLVDTGPSKRILVYRIRSGRLRLIAARSYDGDLEWGLTPDARRGGFSYDTVKARLEVLRRQRKLAGGKPWVTPGPETVLTCDADSDEGRNRIVLVNPAVRTILVYRLDGNSIWLEAARPYDFDLQLLATLPGNAYTYEQVKEQVDAVLPPESPKRSRVTRHP